MKKELKDKHFLKKPEYPGGVRAMQTFLQKQKKYPQDALISKVEGTVHIRYTIDYKGKVVKTKVIAGIGHGCDEEAQRIVSMMKFEVPPNRKMKVQFHKTIHIHFKLPQSSQIEAKVVYTPKPKNQLSDSTGKNKKPGSYEYQITW